MEEKRVYNLSSTYMLPLLKIRKHDFSQNTSNFISCYVSEDDKHLVVECAVPFSTLITNQPTFKLKFEKEGVYYAVFEFPKVFITDVKLFREGKYSQFSDNTKKVIRENSGLMYKKPVVRNGVSVVETDTKLLVLDKDQDLKKHLENKLAVKIHPDAELASIPGEDCFFTLNLSNTLELQNC